MKKGMKIFGSCFLLVRLQMMSMAQNGRSRLPDILAAFSTGGRNWRHAVHLSYTVCGIKSQVNLQIDLVLYGVHVTDFLLRSIGAMQLGADSPRS